MAQLGEFKVTDRGIVQVDEVYYNGEMYCSKLVIPKEIFVEAYEKYILEMEEE